MEKIKMPILISNSEGMALIISETEVDENNHPIPLQDNDGNYFINFYTNQKNYFNDFTTYDESCTNFEQLNNLISRETNKTVVLH